MRGSIARTLESGLTWMPLWLLAAVWLAFASLSPQFRRPETARQILEHSASPAIVAVGITFVLLTAGIDLSVGAVMLVAGAIAGKMLLAGWSVTAAATAMVLVGGSWGLLNGMLITRLKMIPFVVTLAMLFIGRGAGLWITQTRAMNLPQEFRAVANASWLGIRVPIWLLAVSVVLSHVVLTRTPFGRQVYAMGYSLEGARRAGVPVVRNQVLVYGLCSLLAAVGGLITLSQLSAVSPTFGKGRELSAIAAAVLGGVSLFGGRGSAPGAALGAVLVQTIETGLVTVDADPNIRLSIDQYYYPLVTSGVIFGAVLIDSLRRSWLEGRQRRVIRPATGRSP
jgi:ribose/xylose/arabinose/galactoside ABC-type transport system permease subunit